MHQIRSLLTDDVTSNSLSLSFFREYKTIRKENIAIYKKSFRTFFLILGTPTILFLFLAEENLKEQVDKSFNLPPTYETLVSRAQLAAVSFSDS